MSWVPMAMFAVTFMVLLSGYRVAVTLGGVALLFAFGGILTGAFNPGDLGFLPNRLFGIMTAFSRGITPRSAIASQAWASISYQMRNFDSGDQICTMSGRE